MIDPIIANKIKTWYNGLYRGEKYLVLIGTFLVILAVLYFYYGQQKMALLYEKHLSQSFYKENTNGCKECH